MGQFQFNKTFGQQGTGDVQFDTPFDCTVGEGKLFVTDSNNNEIKVFDLLGSFINRFGRLGTGTTEFNQPKGIHYYKGELFILDSGNNRVQIFDDTDSYLREFSSTEETFNNAEFITVYDDEVYVSDSYNQQIQVFDLVGNFIRKFGQQGTGDGEFTTVSGLAFKDDELLAGDENVGGVGFWIIEDDFIIS